MDRQRVRCMLGLIEPAVFVLSLLCCESAGAAQSPLEAIRTTTQQALNVLKDPAFQGAQHRQQRLSRMWEVILPSFDQPAIAQRALGVYWRKLTDEQRAHFTHLFLQLVKNSYSSTLDRYTADAQFFFDSERLDGDYAEVYTRIVSPTIANPFAVVYRLRRHDGQWLVYDVVAENVSMVQNYRAQFYRIINRSSYAELVRRLEAKLNESAVS